MPRPVLNPPNPWSSVHVEWLEEPPLATLEVFEEDAHSVVTGNDSPDVGFQTMWFPAHPGLPTEVPQPRPPPARVSCRHPGGGPGRGAVGVLAVPGRND
jgi:hypothetical protein